MKLLRTLSVTFGAALFVIALVAPGAEGDFGFRNFAVTATNTDGSFDYQAGSHPDLNVDVDLNLEETAQETPEGKLRALSVQLAPRLDRQLAPRHEMCADPV